MHLIDKHLFPKEYDFYVVNDGIDRRSSMLRLGRHRRRSSAAQINKDERRRSSRLQSIKGTALAEPHVVGDKENGAAGESPEDDSVLTPSSSQDADLAELSTALSALNFVPPSLRFGRSRGRGRGGFSKS